ncbi:cytochrome P450 [Streptomyces sp. NPDC005899]|uniref:cytochrome P450 n=1 Tax=Streptomyces sp. NPDC005899 TaxID=3155716 RepID=UPI0033CE273A
MTENTAATQGTVPFARECPFSPPPAYARIREEEPVCRVELPNKETAWALTSYADVRAMLGDTRFSSDNRHPNYPSFSLEKPTEQPIQTMINLDAPAHNEARRKVISEYTAKRIKELRPQVQRIVDARLDSILAGPRPADLVAELAVPVPALVMCEQLGVPLSEHQFFLSNSVKLVSITASETERDEAFGSLAGYLMNLIATKEEEPGDDLLSRQIAKNRESGDYDRMSLMGLAFLLLIAGHETSANTISLGTALLLRHPEQMERVRADPSLTPAMVEEVLRYFTVSELAMVRVATEDVEIGGRVIRAGEGVLGLGNAANHDPSVFPDPDTFDIDRPARNHLAFGHGPHQCLGQSLARLEFQVVFDSLLARLPGLKLAVPFDELRFKGEEGVYGLHELPVSW